MEKKRTSIWRITSPLSPLLWRKVLLPKNSESWKYRLAVNEQKVVTNSIIILVIKVKQDARSTVQRLHRNLGHPSSQAFYNMVESRGASTAVLEIAKAYRCVACLRYHKPIGATVHADIMWIKVDSKRMPMLSIVDMMMKYRVAVLVLGKGT